MVTLEQQRAQDAWNRSAGCSEAYKNLAKGLPTLIMNSGLMQVVAFLHEKGQKDSQRHCRDLGEHLRVWLHSRFRQGNIIQGADFAIFMQSMMEIEKPSDYQTITAEALMWLKWLRQMAAAIHEGGN